MRSWALLALLPVGVHGYRELNSSIDPVAGVHASFAPYAQGFVGYYGDPSTPAAERLNEGSPYSPDTPRIFFSAALQQTCPGMVGPSHNGEFYCHSRDYGYCDRRSGLCVCNQGYTGLDCTACQPGYFKEGGLCFKKTVPMIVHVEERAIMRLVFAPVMRLDEALTAQEEFVPSTNAVLAARVNFVCVARKDFMWNLPTRPALNSVRRSGPRRADPPLPVDELSREFSQTFVYGSQDPRVFDEAEPYTLVPASVSSVPLNESSLACAQGSNRDEGWNCSQFSESHRVCGHRGVFTFASPIYAVAEDATSVTITVQRSGGGLGSAALLYDLQHLTTSPADVSPSMYYTSSQKLVFNPGVVSLAFKLQILDDHIVDGNKEFRLLLREPLAPSDVFAVPTATLGNQWRTLVTILDDDSLRPAANLSYVTSPKTTLMSGGAAGDQLTFQVQSILGNGAPGVDASNEAVFLMFSYIGGYASSESTIYRRLRFGAITQTGATLNCVWQRQIAGNYTVAVQLLYPGGLRGEYFGDAWLGELLDTALTTPAVSRIDRHVNFTWNEGPAFPGAYSHLSVRWSGWLKPLASGSTMFALSVVGYARLWLDSALVIDKWGSGEHTGDLPVINAATTVNVDSSRYYTLVLEYRTPRRGGIYARLLWRSAGDTQMNVIPAQQLFSASHIQGSPFANVTVTPALSASAALSASTLRNGAPSSSPALRVTAGDSFIFNLLPRDIYGNRRRSEDQDGIQRDVVAASLTLVTDRSLGGVGTSAEDGLVTWNLEDDAIRVIAGPQRSGDYGMTVRVNGVALAGSPFTVVVDPAQPSASRCIVSGSGLLTGRVAGQPTTVLLETRDLYGNRIYTGGINQLRLQASHSTSSMPVVVMGQATDNLDGTYTFTYTPLKVGTYSVAVTWKNMHLHNSPYTTTVIPSTPVGPTSSAFGVGIASAQTNVQATFKVISRDSSGNNVTSGGAASSLTVVLEHPLGNVSGNACTDLLNGHYTCTYSAHYVGLTRLHVLLTQRAIKGSPFLVNVTAGPALGSRCVATGAALVSSVAGQRTNFTVSIYDSFGNAKTDAGSENVVAIFKGPGALISTVASANIAISYIGGGVFVVAYTLNLKGIYTISVTVNGVAVISSPFTMYTYPATASPVTTSLDLITPAPPRSQADPPVVFIAGALIVTRLTTRDSYGNVLETGGNYFYLDKAVRAFLNAPIVDEKNGSYLIALRPTRSTLFPFTPRLLMPEGVNGSYYDANAVPDTTDPDPAKSLLEVQRRDTAINFDFGDRPPKYVQSAKTFSIRWEGFLLPQFSEIYTFEVEAMGLANLRVGSSTATVPVGEASASVKVPLTAQIFVQLDLNFSKPQDLPNAAVKLLWSSLSQVRVVIPPSQLFTSWRIVNNVPPLDIKPALAAPTAFTADFKSAWLPASGFVQAVDDKPLIFIVAARDSFGNQLTGEDYCSLYVKLPQVTQGTTQPDLVITDLLDGSYKVSLTPHLTGIFSLLIAALPDAQKPNAPAGGAALVSFLGAYNIKGSPFTLQVDPGLPSATKTTLIGGGFVTTTAGIRTAFALELRDASSNLLTITMVTSYLSQVQVKLKSVSKGTEVFMNVTQVGDGDPAFFSAQEVRVEYTATLAGLYAVLLSVDGGTTFTQKTAVLSILPNAATAATSLVSSNGIGVAATGGGLGPQISTNQGYTYHVTVRDTFGNIRTSGGDLVIVRIYGPEILIGTITDLSNGDYVVAYRVARPGAYEIQTSIAEPGRGLMGYYYVDATSLQQNLPTAVRGIDAVINFDWSVNATMRGYPRIIWRGFLRPLYTEYYTFSVQRDAGSGAGVSIDGQRIIDGLNTDATSGLVGLVGGRLYAITVEYRSASTQETPGYLSLSWNSKQQTLEIIPSQALIAEAKEILPRTQVVAV